MTPKEIEAEAQRMLSEMLSQFPHDSATLVHRPSLLALLRELAAAREANRKLHAIVDMASMLIQPNASTGTIDLIGHTSFRSKLMLAARAMRREPAPPPAATEGRR